MKKNNIIHIVFMALSALMLTSCLKDQEELFEDSASARVTKYLGNAKEVLTSAENGWVLNYYPDRDMSYGGTPFVLKFNDETVAVSSSLVHNPTETVESGYILNNEDGPVLSFDTYNELMHYFSTPSGSSGPGGYEAYDGDFIFIIMGISDDNNVITLKGNRTGNIMYMHRLKESGEKYLSKVLEVDENMPDIYSFTSNGETVSVTLSSGIATFKSNHVDEKVAYILTDKGVEFHDPVDINGVVLNGIKNSGDAKTTQSIGDKPVTLNVVYFPLNEIFINNNWYLSYDNQSEYVRPYFDAAIAGSASEGEEISLMEFTEVNGFSLSFISGVYAGALAFDVEFIGKDKVKLTYNGANNYLNGDWYYMYEGYDQLVELLERTFTLVPNKKTKPTVIKLVDDSDENNVIVVTAAPAAF